MQIFVYSHIVFNKDMQLSLRSHTPDQVYLYYQLYELELMAEEYTLYQQGAA